MAYWLMKTEPNAFSWQDLLNKPDSREHWDGVRNYQARNNMREMKVGDLVFIYHSVIKPQEIAGIAKVVKEAYTDHTQFDPASKYFDPKSKEDNPRWIMVDVQAVQAIEPPITRNELQMLPELQEMVLFKNTRLSVQPVTETEWKMITGLRKSG